MKIFNTIKNKETGSKINILFIVGKGDFGDVSIKIHENSKTVVCYCGRYDTIDSKTLFAYYNNLVNRVGILRNNSDKEFFRNIKQSKIDKIVKLLPSRIDSKLEDKEEEALANIGKLLIKFNNNTFNARVRYNYGGKVHKYVFSSKNYDKLIDTIQIFFNNNFYSNKYNKHIPNNFKYNYCILNDYAVAKLRAETKAMYDALFKMEIVPVETVDTESVDTKNDDYDHFVSMLSEYNKMYMKGHNDLDIHYKQHVVKTLDYLRNSSDNDRVKTLCGVLYNDIIDMDDEVLISESVDCILNYININ